MYTDVRRRRSRRSPANLAYAALAHKSGLQQHLQRPSLGHVGAFRACITAMRMHPSAICGKNVCQKPAPHMSTISSLTPQLAYSPGARMLVCQPWTFHSAGGAAHKPDFCQSLLAPCDRVATCLNSVLLFQQQAVVLQTNLDSPGQSAPGKLMLIRCEVTVLLKQQQSHAGTGKPCDLGGGGSSDPYVRWLRLPCGSPALQPGDQHLQARHTQHCLVMHR